jgi:hypothetical protein
MSKTQPTATTHTQRKHIRHGQTASAGLSLTQEGETGQTGLANQSGRLCPETPQKTFGEKTCLKNLSSFEQE